VAARRDEGLARELERAWADRVRANREQVERRSQVVEASDFYAPVSARFVADPRRSGDVVRDALLARAHAGERWLDIGAGAGRYALPLALVVREVIAVEPSPAMVDGLRAGMAEHGIANVRIEEMRWPPDGEPPHADVALICQVGYDIEAIGPFVDAMEAAAPRRVAVMMERPPAGYADPFWPLIHGEERISLPALDELLALLTARGSEPRISYLSRPPGRWPDEESLLAQLRHQLWIGQGSAADQRLVAEVRARLVRDEDGIGLPAEAARVGVVEWR